ncbi:polyprenyl synthetase family protein [Chloracidobacterium validum]|uniref:Polyprenyl synthetase family protein n=1 Tax=Chloracidobacterium validum TaxID=2821543 RepID=A0ABX8B7Y3_9BACT|nr:polyprenyl synthetase family protein [Chloracidobacterium validum]QUW03052.1 polyprenyl synthetase family protein [Chloracidobacterium validum]
MISAPANLATANGLSIASTGTTIPVAFAPLVERVHAIAQVIDAAIADDLEEVTQPELRQAVTYLFEGKGKRLRPFLVITTAEAAGGRFEDAIPPALAVEYLHNLSLIHDDMMDGSTERHAQSTLHTRFGLNLSLLVGDLLYAKAVEQSARIRRHALRMVHVLGQTAKQMCYGQFDDLNFERRLDLDVEDYLRMASRKTSALYRASCLFGMLTADADEADLLAMATFGEKIGTAFQIWDDVLDLQADPLRLGKPIGLDIRDGKKTLIVIHFLKHASPAARGRFLKLLGKRDLNGELAEAISLLEETGSIDFARKLAIDHLIEAKQHLAVLPDSPHRVLLNLYADFMLQRRH